MPIWIWIWINTSLYHPFTGIGVTVGGAQFAGTTGSWLLPQPISSSSFSAFPSYISGVHPTIKVVTFRLRGWCVLGVFLLPAFTRLGHERQDLLSPCDEMHVCTD